MFYRRKVILALLQAFGGELEKIALQKLLFLFAVRQEKSVYEFVPYQYGCYSFSARADMNAMAAKGDLLESEMLIQKKTRDDFISSLAPSDKEILRDLYAEHSGKTPQELMRQVYLSYPYYAIHSRTASVALTKGELSRVEAAKPKNAQTILYTIGYEGVSLEAYLNKMIKNDVRVLVDVRNNPISMKFGFSKGQLQGFCEKVGIEYVHIPEVGIVSKFRKTLESKADYQKLFEQYRTAMLPKTVSHQERILRLLAEKKRVALTCFEADVNQCHRKHLSEKIAELPKWNYQLIHI
jgi:uncharacterized protein (DUF488 family)